MLTWVVNHLFRLSNWPRVAMSPGFTTSRSDRVLLGRWPPSQQGTIDQDIAGHCLARAGAHSIFQSCDGPHHGAQ